MCTHTRQVEHQRCSRAGRVQKNSEILRKNAIINEHPVALQTLLQISDLSKQFTVHGSLVTVMKVDFCAINIDLFIKNSAPINKTFNLFFGKDAFYARSGNERGC